jgi:hypothetical protein
MIVRIRPSPHECSCRTISPRLYASLGQEGHGRRIRPHKTLTIRLNDAVYKNRVPVRIAPTPNTQTFFKIQTKEAKNLPGTQQANRSRIIQDVPPLCFDFCPPSRITLVARHDDVLHVDALTLAQFFLHFTDATRDHGHGWVTFLYGEIATVRPEVVATGVNGDVLEEDRV